MKTLVIFLVLIFSFHLTNAFKDSKCKNSSIEAKKDMKKGRVCLMIQGGIVSTYKKGQEVFEKKYSVKYVDLGCVGSNNLCIEHYNAEVANSLDRKYGKAWRKMVRTDVEGLKTKRLM